MTDLFLLAAEPSADLQGSLLAQKLLEIDPRLKLSSVAGPKMRALGLSQVLPMEELQVMGFIDVLLALPKLARTFFKLRSTILEMNPKAVICIDYPGFNLRLERSLRRKGYRGKLIHYVCPTVWAWGKKRIPLMANNLDLLLTFLPFEPKCFSSTALDVRYVGHPLVCSIQNHSYNSTFPKKKILSLFPGSRKTEIERNLPLQWECAKKLQAEYPELTVAVSLSHEQFRPLVREVIGEKAWICPPEQNYDLMKQTYLALATSGTVILELGLHQVPTVVTFAIKPWDVFIARNILRIRLPFYSIVNIILQKEVFPELFGPHLSKENLLHQARELFSSRRELCKKDLKELIAALGTNDAAFQAAKAIAEKANL